MEPQVGDTVDAPTARVVVLTGDAPFGERIDQAVGGRANVVRAASGYEVAAELLKSGAEAVVIDLGAMSRRDAGLPGVVREAGAAAFAVGELPGGLSSEDLDGIRIVAREDVADLAGEQLRRTEGLDAAAGPVEPESARPAEHGERPGATGEPEPREPETNTAAAEVEPTEPRSPGSVFPPSSESADGEGKTEESDEDGQRPDDAPQEARGEDASGTYVPEREPEETARPGDPTGLLTPEELDALLRSDL